MDDRGRQQPFEKSEDQNRENGKQRGGSQSTSEQRLERNTRLLRSHTDRQADTEQAQRPVRLPEGQREQLVQDLARRSTVIPLTFEIDSPQSQSEVVQGQDRKPNAADDFNRQQQESLIKAAGDWNTFSNTNNDLQQLIQRQLEFQKKQELQRARDLEDLKNDKNDEYDKNYEDEYDRELEEYHKTHFDSEK